MKSQPQRWTKQQQQESISRYQLATRLSEYGWVPESVSPDLGEDFIVNIYDSGIWSGLSFYIQEKSTQTLDQSAIRDERITYRVRVKDLLHWTPAALPVIFIVWDINQKTGYWINIADVIARLTEQKDNWHQQKTVQIQIPVSNQTDDTGLSQIRSIVANYSFPSVAKDKKLELNVTFRFPRTSAGDAIRDALERAIAIGDTVEISEKFVEKVEFSEWYTRLHGGIPSKGSIKIGPPKQKISLPTRLDVISSNGLSASIPYMDMQIIKSGTEETTFSNIHHDSPLHFTFIFNTRLQTLNLSVEVNSTNPGPNVKDTRDALLFLMALSKSGKLRLTNLSTQDSFEVHSPFDISAAHQNTEFYDLVDKLCMIQEKTGSYIALKEWYISDESVEIINELITLFKTGKIIVQKRTMFPTFKRDVLEIALEAQRIGQGINLKTESFHTKVRLLEVDIPLGLASWQVTGILEMPVEELEQTLMALDSEDGIEIELFVMDGVGEFSNWLPNNIEDS